MHSGGRDKKESFINLKSNMKTVERIRIIQASPEKVFDCIDDLGVSGMHMTESSMPMMGGKMDLEFLTPYKTGFHTKYRWTGKVLWWNMDFTVLVTNWIRGKEKTWETIGISKLIIYSWFRMNLKVGRDSTGTIALLSISYEKPKGFLNKILCFLVGNWYCKWCINNMLRETEKKLTLVHKVALANS
jgi:hypothetical protein